MTLHRFGLALAVLGCLLPAVLAAAPAGKRLTLNEALAAAVAAHPDLRIAEAERAAAVAEQESTAARTDLAVNLEAGLRRGHPTTDSNTTLSDNNIRLSARKNLYDFGRSASSEQAAMAVVAARDAGLLEAGERRRIEVMSRFFEVLLADLQYTADTEYMAVAYVNADRAKDRQQVGQLAAAEVAGLEHRYQELLVRRNASLARARLARVQLANAMNLPGQIIAELEDPKLPANNLALPEYEALLPLMLERNPRLRAQLAQLDASRSRMEAWRAESAPALDAEFETGRWSRESVTRDDVKAGVVLTWPLYQGRRVSAQLAREQAQFHKLQAEADRLRMNLSEALLEAWLEAEQLQRSGRAAAKQQVAYRDLALEKARGQYETELKADLGDAMAATMEAKLRQRRTEYQLALAFARLEALLGERLENIGKGRVK